MKIGPFKIDSPSCKIVLIILFFPALISNNNANKQGNRMANYIKEWQKNPDYTYKACDSLLKNDKELTSAEHFDLLKLQGKIMLDKYVFKTAFDKYSQALEIIHKLDSTEDIKQKHKANIMNNIGNIMAYQGLYSISLKNYTEAFNIYSKLKDVSGQAICLNNLGYVYETQRLFDKARTNYWKAYLLNTIIQNKSGQAMNLANIGAIYEAEQKFESALIFNYKSLEIRKQLKDTLEIGACYNAIGQIYLNSGELKKSLTYFKIFLGTKQSIKNTYPLAVTYKNIGDYYSKTKQIDSCTYFYNKALEIAIPLKSYSLIYDNASNLSKSYAQLGLFVKAYEMEQYAKTAKDTLSQQLTLQEISKQELKNDFELKQKENEFNQKKKEFRFWGFIIALFGLIIITILLIIRQRLVIFNKNLEEQNLILENAVLQKEVESKSKELTTSSLYLAKKNEILNQLERQLQNVNKQTTNEAEKKFRIHEMINTVKNNTNENAWKDFEIRFNEVHTHFYDNLLKIHPKISLNERRLCSFLRLNMTTKEISALTQQTPHSINIARFRLRKKLGLKSEESLENFLSTF